MAHDRFNRLLKVGDVVLVPMVVKDIFATEEYCNCFLESIYGRRPDGHKETLSSVNTGVLVRADFGET